MPWKCALGAGECTGRKGDLPLESQPLSQTRRACLRPADSLSSLQRSSHQTAFPQSDIFLNESFLYSSQFPTHCLQSSPAWLHCFSRKVRVDFILPPYFCALIPSKLMKHPNCKLRYSNFYLLPRSLLNLRFETCLENDRWRVRFCV